MYQGRSTAASRAVLMVEIPEFPTDMRDRVLALMDEFGEYLRYRIPEVTVTKTAVARTDAGPAPLPRVGLSIDRPTRQVMADGELISLAYKEFELLAYLAQHPRRIVSRAELIANVWDSEFASPRTIDTHVRRIRVKLGPHAMTLTTVRGKGYRFDPHPSTRFRGQRPIRSA